MERICKILLVLIAGFFISLSPITLSNLKADTVQDIKEITELYKEGILTKEEFSKAKAKILGIEKQSEKEQNAKKKLKAKEEKKALEDAVSKVKTAKESSNSDDLKTAVDELNNAWNAVASKMYETAKEPGATDNSKETKSKSKTKSKKKDDAEIEDADFEVVD